MPLNVHRNPTTALDQTLHLLADHIRRTVILVLMDHSNGRLPVGELAHRIAEWDARQTGRPPDPEDIVMQLAHDHLPRLADAGIIDVDWEAETVEYIPHDRVERILQFVRDLEID